MIYQELVKKLETICLGCKVNAYFKLMTIIFTKSGRPLLYIAYFGMN